MSFFVWFGKRGFMRGAVWSFLLLIAWVVLLGTIQTLTNVSSPVSATNIIVLIGPALYILGYYYLPSMLYKNS